MVLFTFSGILFNLRFFLQKNTLNRDLEPLRVVFFRRPAIARLVLLSLSQVAIDYSIFIGATFLEKFARFFAFFHLSYNQLISTQLPLLIDHTHCELRTNLTVNVI